jgi:hypothetical protein
MGALCCGGMQNKTILTAALVMYHNISMDQFVVIQQLDKPLKLFDLRST